MNVAFSKCAMLLAALSFGACTAQGPTLNSQAEQMELALVACKAQLGFGGQLKTNVSFDGGIASAVAVPFDQVTASQAAQINACAAGGDTLSDGLVVVPMVPTAPVAVASTLPVTIAEVAPPVADIPVSNAGCPAGFTGMYAGTLYCTGARN